MVVIVLSRLLCRVLDLLHDFGGHLEQLARGCALVDALTVNGAVDIARFFGVSETVIGLTIVAIGTSLPELVTSVMGLSSRGFNLPDTPINNAINKDLLEFQRLVNRLPLSYKEKRSFHQELMQLTRATQGLNLFNETPMLTISKRNEIMAYYAESNRQLSNKYLNGAELFPAQAELASPPEYQDTALNEEKLAYILGWILAKKD